LFFLVFFVVVVVDFRRAFMLRPNSIEGRGGRGGQGNQSPESHFGLVHLVPTHVIGGIGCPDSAESGGSSSSVVW
jgi:hypothetical protein